MAIDYTYHAGETTAQYAARTNSSFLVENPKPVNTQLYAKPGEDYNAYETRLGGGSTPSPTYQSGDGQGFGTPIPYTPAPAVTGDILGGGTQPDMSKQMATPNNTVTDTSSIYDTLTASQQKAQDKIDSVMSLNDILVGKSDYTAEQQKLYGIPALQDTADELTQQLLSLKNEAAAIPLQLQQGAAERGVTTSVLGRQENSRLRTNAIAALSVSALMAGVENKLTIANRRVEQAVQEKYGHIEAQIEASMKNLELFMNSPVYTNEEKKRAQQQYDIEEQKKYDLSVSRQNFEDTQKIAVTAASQVSNFTPTTEYPTAALALTAMQKATSPVEATLIAQSVGLFVPEKGQESWSDPYMLGGDYVQKNEATGELRTAVNVSNGSGDSDPSSSPGVSGPALQQNLYDVGLPPTSAKADGSLTSNALAKVISAGVPPEVAQAIWDSITKDGKTLEQVRKELLDEFKDRDLAYGYLDKFMQALQGGTSSSGNTSSGNTSEINFDDL